MNLLFAILFWNGLFSYEVPFFGFKLKDNGFDPLEGVVGYVENYLLTILESMLYSLWTLISMNNMLDIYFDWICVEYVEII